MHNFKQYIILVNNRIDLLTITLYSIIFSGIYIFIDYFDIPSKLLNIFPLYFFVFCAVLTVIAIIIIISKTHIFDLFKIREVNLIDSCIFGVMIFTFICLLWSLNFKINLLYKSVIFSLLIILEVIIFLCRFSNNKHFASKNNLLELKDILNNSFFVNKNEPILLVEKDIDYDLLNRSNIINRLYKTIVCCKWDYSFTIGLEGQWGSGKTTILNNVKKMIKQEHNNDIVLIDDFDMWTLGNENAILMSLFDSLLKGSGIKYSVSRRNKIIKSLVKSLSDVSPTVNAMQPFFMKSEDADETKKLNETLVQHLKLSNKKYVVFIDNIDRASADNILYMLRIIATYFNLPNVVYILSYDRERLNNLLKDNNKIDSHYLEKIIQMVINVPIINRDCLINVYKTCLHNLIRKYEPSVENINEYDIVIKTLTDNVIDIRNFIRFINSCFNATFVEDTPLLKKELFLLETIRFLSPELYYDIYNNRQYFVSEDRMLDENSLVYMFDKERFNDEGKEFFKKIISKYTTFENVLYDMFPYVKKYISNQDIISNYNSKNGRYENISKNMQICSAKYFDLYFSYINNEFVNIGINVRDTIKAINTSNEDEIFDIIKTVDNIPPYEQKEWFERFQLYIADIDYSKLLYVINALFRIVNNVNDSTFFLQLNAKTRLCIIIADAFERLNEEDSDYFVSMLKDCYRSIIIISDIIYWTENSYSYDNQKTHNLKLDKLKEKYNNLCTTIFKDEIDLYSNENYCQKNIYGLVRFVSENESYKQKFENYMRKIVSQENIYRILCDILSLRTGNNYEYFIEQKNFEYFQLTTDIVDEFISINPPETKTQFFLQAVYEKYKNGEKNDYGGCTVITAEEMIFDL